MIDQQNLSFNELYDKTYQDVLKYVVCKCFNINDVNDIMQETYLELYKLLKKKKLFDKNMLAYIKGIANNKVKKHYSILYRIQSLLLFGDDFIDNIKDDIDLDRIILKDEAYKKAWDYIKHKKGLVAKIFFFYYYEDLSIKEIAQLLGKNESYVKNSLYRTLKELKQNFGKESELI